MTQFESIYLFEHLYQSYLKSRHGKCLKYTIAKFEINAVENLLKLSNDVKNHTYTMADYNTFTVYEPKERIIMSNAFRDKILQRSLCDYVLNPSIFPHLIYDNYASQQNKGTHFGLNRLCGFLHSYYRKYGSEGWILKADISKYFYCIRHDKLKEQLLRYVSDDDVLWLLNLIIDSTDGIGVPIGNQTSQTFAVLYLNDLDHLIKDQMGFKYYGRYMDDFYIIHHDKTVLQNTLRIIEKKLNDLGLNLNHKTQILPLRNGIDFLGFHTYLTDSGKVIRKIRRRSKNNMRRKIKKMSRLYKDGKIDKESIIKSYQSWRSHASHGNSHHLIQNMDSEINKIINNQQE